MRVEAGPGCAAALAGVDPLAVDARRARVLLRRRAGHHVLVQRGGKHTRLAAVHVGADHAAVPDEELPAGPARQPFSRGQLGRAGRGEASVAPDAPDRRAHAARRKLVDDARRGGRGLGEERRRLGLDAGGLAELQRPERRVHRVAGDVAQRPGPVVPPAAPAERVVRRMVRPVRRRTQEEIPVETGRRVVRLGRPLDRLRPDRPVGPVVHLAHRADDARLQPLADLPRPLPGVTLVAHLRRHARLAGGRGQRAGLGHRARQRLLAVDVLAAPQRLHRDDGVRVVGSRDDHGVEVRLAVEHLPVVRVDAGVRKLAQRARGESQVGVAQRRDVLAAAAPDVGPSPAAHADAGNVERVARRLHAGPAQHVTRHDHQRGGRSRGRRHEPTTRDLLAHFVPPLTTPARPA